MCCPAMRVLSISVCPPRAAFTSFSSFLTSAISPDTFLTSSLSSKRVAAIAKRCCLVSSESLVTFAAAPQSATAEVIKAFRSSLKPVLDSKCAVDARTASVIAAVISADVALDDAEPTSFSRELKLMDTPSPGKRGLHFDGVFIRVGRVLPKLQAQFGLRRSEAFYLVPDLLQSHLHVRYATVARCRRSLSSAGG